MCLAVPGRLLSLFDQEGLRLGDVDFGGVTRRVCLAYVPEAVEGTFVLVHAGFAITIVDEREAERTLQLLQEIDQLDEPESS
jgi:hydrogenase expression/formation protein HypC